MEEGGSVSQSGLFLFVLSSPPDEAGLCNNSRKKGKHEVDVSLEQFLRIISFFFLFFKKLDLW